MARAPGKQKPKSGGQSAAENAVTTEVLSKLDGLVPAGNREEVAIVIEETISELSHSGPLPRPSDLAGYEAIQTGFAERIMRMAEKEQSNRINSINSVIDRDYKLKSRGQAFALASVAILTAFAAFLAEKGATSDAAWVAGVAIVGVVGIFVSGRIISTRPRAADDEDSES